MRVYISGPISSDPDYEVKFRRAAKMLKDRGMEYVNPAEIANAAPGLSWVDYMKIDLALLDKCDAIMFLKGWASSAGACKEAIYAKSKGLPVYHLYEGRLTE